MSRFPTRAFAMFAVILLPFTALTFGCWRSTEMSLDQPGDGTGSDGDSDTDANTDADTDTEAPAVVWVRSAGGPGADRASHVATAADGTSIAVGSFEATAVFGEGETGETALIAAGDRDLFMAAFGPDGALRWAKRAGGAGYDDARCVSVFADSSSVITGLLHGAAVFGEGEPNETTLQFGDDDYAYFIAWYAADGGLLAVRSAVAGGSVAAGYAVAALGDGSVIVAGVFTDSIVLGEGEAGEVELTATPGNQQAFVARYDPSHTLAFARATDGDYDLYPFDVVALPGGSFALAGAFTGTVILGPGEANETTFTSEGGYDLLVARFGADGALAWARTAAAAALPSPDDKARAIGPFGADGVAVAGFYAKSVTFGDGESAETTLTGNGGGMFTAAYDPDGDLAWAVKAGKGQGYALSSVEGAAGPIYAAGLFGAFYDTITFGADGPDECTLVGVGGDDIALAKYDGEGGVLWARAMGGEGDEELGALSVLPDGSPVLVGSFMAEAVFDLGQPADDTVVSAGDRDAFIARLAP